MWLCWIRNEVDRFGRYGPKRGHDQLVFQLVKIQLVTVSVSDISVSNEFS